MNLTKLATLLIVLIVALATVGCDALLEEIKNHEHSYTDWIEVSEPTCYAEGTERRYCIICFDEEQRAVDRLPHTEELFTGKAATCTEEGYIDGIKCSVCGLRISGLDPIPALGHTEVIDPAIDPIGNTPGKTEGKHCSVCGEILIRQQSVFLGDFSDKEKYDGDYGFGSLSDFENGASMQAFYMDIDRAADDFHTSDKDAKTKENDENTIYYAAEIDFSKYGISSDEALTVWCAYRTDRPLYYWISNHVSYTDTYITLEINDEYADADVRAEYNDRIYSAVNEYISALNGETETYLITLAFHDKIIDSAEYAYVENGAPSSATSAHNIIGVLLEGEGVCESYTKVFQLLLNYCGIDNVFVSGWAGEAHAWNLVCLDGGWYWYDLTWDDTSGWGRGIGYSYFCVNDTQNVNWHDGAKITSTHSFLDDHTPNPAGGEGVGYSYSLPDRSSEIYDYEGVMLRDRAIVIDGFHYVIDTYNTVCLTKIEAEGDVVIPESINYQGREYTVASIGSIEKGIFMPGNILYYIPLIYKSKITSVSIPATVEFIWDFAFDGSGTIEKFIVDERNEYFTAKDGALFTKTLYTLIKFPMASELSSYSMPDETVELAYNAFGDGGNVFCPKNLRKLIIGKNVSVIGAGNFGKGYRDSKPKSESDIVFADGYLDLLKAMIQVDFHSDNKHFE